MDESARQYAAALPMIALGVAALISAWAVFAVVLLASPWAVSVLLPWSHRMRRDQPRRFALIASLGVLIVLAGIATAFAVDVAAPGALTAAVALLAITILVGDPLLRGRA